MKQKVWVLGVILLAVLATAIPALADAPSTGTVVEGVRVPGIALGDSRAQVEAAWGAPASCTNLPYFDGRQGLNGICDFDVSGGGRVTVRYFAPDGGPAQNAPDDVASSVRWPEAVSGWTTTAGVNTILAKSDPAAVIAAYPDAEVTYTMFGGVYSVFDAAQGIGIVWEPNFYNGTVHVSMSISGPRDSAPQPAQYSVVADIELTAVKIKRERQIVAQVLVHNAQDLAAAGATVSATWIFPDGSRQTAAAVTSGSGLATFALNGRLERGTYYLLVDDVELADHIYDYTSGLRSASINVK